MRLLTFRTNGGTRAGRLDGDQVVELADADVGALLARGDGGLDDARNASGGARPLAELDLAPVILDPPKIICVGQNYIAHIEEQGVKVPDYPTLFNKFRRSLVGPNDEIVLPKVSDSVDWEVELTIVIGKHARHVTAGEAEDAIFGYTILNDTSIRDWQFRTTQWMQGKAFEASTPLGPVVVSRDEVDAGNLRLWTELDGQVMQDSNTSDMLFKPAELVAYCSQMITLEPGDVIATGTPSGVGFARKPPVFLQPGQTIRCSVEGIGSLVNQVVKET
jgi:acylpyruvate hydrolase